MKISCCDMDPFFFPMQKTANAILALFFCAELLKLHWVSLSTWQKIALGERESTPRCFRTSGPCKKQSQKTEATMKVSDVVVTSSRSKAIGSHGFMCEKHGHDHFGVMFPSGKKTSYTASGIDGIARDANGVDVNECEAVVRSREAHFNTPTGRLFCTETDRR